MDDARGRGDRVALGRALLAAGPIWRGWQELVTEVSTWRDDAETARSIASLAALLDELDVESLREAPAPWWNALQRGQPAPGWPLVRRLVLGEQPTFEPFDAGRAPSSLAAITHLDADEDLLAPTALIAARAVRTLRYELASRRDRSREPLEALEAVAATVEELDLVLKRAPLDLAPLVRLGRLRALKLTLKVPRIEPRDPLAALDGLRLDTLRVHARAGLPSLDGLRLLPTLRVLQVDGAPVDLTPLATLTSLEELFLAPCSIAADRAPIAPSVRTLHLSGAAGLRSFAPLDHLQRLEILRINDCPALVDPSVTSLPSLRELSIGPLHGDALRLLDVPALRARGVDVHLVD